jgi:hypothetical protein
VKPNQTPITEDASVLENIMSTQKNITEIYQERSYDELTEALNEYLNGDSQSEDQSVEETKESNQANTVGSNQSTDAFDDLFNS